MNQAALHHETAPPDFNRLARLYRWMEAASFGPYLHRCRCAFLSAVLEYRRAVVLGDGDGRFTADLLRANPVIQIDAVDASSAMLRELIRHAGANTSRVHISCADARYWYPAHPPYDLVVTHFFLDCLSREEVLLLAETLRASVAPSALWLVSEFAIPRGWYGRLVARPLIASLYYAFGLLTDLKTRALPNHRSALRQSGFKLIEERRQLGGLLVSELWSVTLR